MRYTYCVVKAVSVEALATLVNQQMVAGWECTGGIAIVRHEQSHSINPETYYQAMIRGVE